MSEAYRDYTLTGWIFRLPEGKQVRPCFSQGLICPAAAAVLA